jgi:hypothetical protein|eukprot:COSAG06_NODE_3176_length_5734_cov_36.258917_2_plen_1180_part_00
MEKAKAKAAEAKAKAAAIAKEEGAKAAAIAKEKGAEAVAAAKEKGGEAAVAAKEKAGEKLTEARASGTYSLAEESAITKVQALQRSKQARAATEALDAGQRAVLEKARQTASKVAASTSDVESTVDRRNVLLTRNEGDVNRSLGMVTSKGLLTERLPGLAASSIPFVGVAYNMINPVWEQMRAVCLVAALYGHDLEKDEDIKTEVLICVMGDRAEMKAKGKKKGMGDQAVKAAMDKLTASMSAKFAAQQASALAICSGPIAPVIGAMTGAAMNKATHVSAEHAIEYFQEGSRVMPEEEWKVDIKASVSAIQRIDMQLQQAYDAADDRLDISGRSQAVVDVAAAQARAAADIMDDKLAISDKVSNARQASAVKSKELVYKAQDKAVAKFQHEMDVVADTMVQHLVNSLALPKFLRNIIAQLINDIVEEIQAEGVYHIESILAHHEKDQRESPDRLKEINCLQRIRGWILYHWMPYDHTSFYKLSDPVWIFLKLLAVLPFGGMFFFYLILWCLIDKSDTFQLVKFIVDFKGLQALSLGLGCIFIGASKYVRCANQVPYPTCEQNGPGAGDAFVFGFSGWIGCVLLVWITFVVLKCRARDIKTGEHAGGKLTSWLFYDLIIFAFCSGMVWASYLKVGMDYETKEMLFWCKGLYGVLSFPFVVYMLPLVDVLFTHAHVTAYTPSGVCRKPLVIGPEETLREKAAQNLESNSALNEILTEMLDVAISGGPLPINDWSARLAPGMEHMADAWQHRVDRVKSHAEDKGGGLKGIASGTFAVAKDDGRAQSKVALATAANTMARQIVFSLNASLELPKFLSSAVESIVMGFVPDITDTLGGNVVNKLEEKTGLDLDGDGDLGTAGKGQVKGRVNVTAADDGSCSLRGAILHTWMPYNSTGGGPIGQLLNFLAGFPILGTNYAMCVLMFLLIDRSEYQLTRFCLSFKGMQAISTGLVFTFIGVLTYMNCIAGSPTDTGSGLLVELDTCDQSSLATFPLFYAFIGSWLIAVVCVWLGFILLIRIHTKQIKQLTKDALEQGVDANVIDVGERLDIAGKEGLRSRTKAALYYDIFIMVLCFGIVSYYEGVHDLDDWQRRQLLFWSHALYGVLSLPFILTMLPVAHLLFNAAPATGYARSGQCLRLNLTGSDGKKAKAEGLEEKFINPMADTNGNGGYDDDDSDDDDADGED